MHLPPRFGPSFLVSIAVLPGLAAAQAGAQESAPATERNELAEAVGAAARSELGDPTLMNRVLDRPSSGRVLRLFEGLHVRFQVQDGSASDDPSLGFAFDFAKSLGIAENPESESLDLVARGNVAFDRDANPDDFLEVFARARWFGSSARGSGDTTRAERVQALADPTAEELASLSAGGEPGKAGDASFRSLSRAWTDRVARTLPTELVWDFDLHAGLESNQSFSSRQLVFGTSTGLRYLAWDPDAALSRWNVFDVPGAALRWLAGTDEGFHPSGLAWPTIVAGLDVVDASAEDSRDAVTDDESFLRMRLETTLRTRVATIGEHDLHLAAAWRWFQELDAPSTVRRADTDDSSHLQLDLELPAGWELSYATGRLPIDDREGSTFSLGFHVQF